MKRKNKKKKRIIYSISIIVSIISFIILMYFSYFLLNLNMIPDKYLTIFFIVVSVFYSSLYLLTIVPTIKSGFKVFACILLVLFSCGFQFGSHYVDKTIAFIDKVNDNLFQNEEYYLVTLENSSMENVASANTKIIGFYKNNSANTESAVNSLKEKINFTEKDYEDVVTMFEELENHKVDALLINSSTKNLLDEDLSYLNLNIKDLGTVLVPIKTVDIVKVVDVTNTPFNIYIAGGDSYGTIDKVMNTDVNMIVTVDAKNRKLLLTSIPRDYYVHLANLGDNAYDKLTHAGYYGIETSVKSIEELLDIEINYYAKVNFSTIEGIINAIGGVDIYSEHSFCANGCPNVCYTKGNMHLDGYHALMFARERVAFSNGDIQRVKNQQKVISAIINKITSSTKLVTNYSDILNSVSSNFSTNLDSKSISRIVKMQLNDMRGWTIESQNLTGYDLFTKGTYTFPSVKLYVMEKNEESVINARTKILEILGGN